MVADIPLSFLLLEVIYAVDVVFLEGRVMRFICSPLEDKHAGEARFGPFLGLATINSWRRRMRGYDDIGLDLSDVELVVGTRGGHSRLSLMRAVETPQYRGKLSELTGLDWKEVDRNIRLLQSHRLVAEASQVASIKLYVLTAEGRRLLRFIEDALDRERSETGLCEVPQRVSE